MTASDPIEEAARAEAGVWLADGEARLDRARLGAAAEAVGRVERMGDGIALVSGLPDIRLMELLDMGEGRRAFAVRANVEVARVW